MLPDEILVWRAFLRRRGLEFDSFEYNLRLGRGEDPGPGFSDVARRGAILNSQRRLDAVGFQRNQATIFEVKRRAGASAVGQLFTYLALWRAENQEDPELVRLGIRSAVLEWKRAHPGAPDPKLVLVANIVPPDVHLAAERNGIAVELVTADFSVLRHRFVSFP